MIDFNTLTSKEFLALDREKTLFLVVLGTPELIASHSTQPLSPDLPLNDQIHLAKQLGKSLAQAFEIKNPGWNIVWLDSLFLGTRTWLQPQPFRVRGHVVRDFLIDWGTHLRKQKFVHLACLTLDSTATHLTALHEASALLYRFNNLKRFKLYSVGTRIDPLGATDNRSDWLSQQSKKIEILLTETIQKGRRPNSTFAYRLAWLPWNSSYFLAYLLSFGLASIMVMWILTYLLWNPLQ
jgi:hypothetical protein